MRTWSGPVAGTAWSRISPRPGAAIQKARAVPGEAVTESPFCGFHRDDTIPPSPHCMRTAAWRLPDQPLRGAALTAVAAALLAVTAAAAAFRAVLPLGVWFLVRPALVLVLGAVLAAPSLGRHHPFPRLGAANLVTL
jgi:hypothetical protein